ncbi:MAG: YhcH/YjgK/YiaL family protein [Clostridium sp.]|nr:YhcH/YjgK/YiaL family protein [Clostridium sp.]
MIADRIENAHLYYCLGERFEKALRFLATTDLSGYEPGEYEIDGRDVFVRVQTYETTEPERCKIELHRLYADVQYIVEGEELFGYVHRRYTEPKIPYDDAIEMALVSCTDMGHIIQRPGCFAIAFPDDAHQSMITHTTPQRVKKALVKVRL